MRLFKRCKKHGDSLSINALPGPRIRAWRLVALFPALFPLCATALLTNTVGSNSVVTLSTNYAVMTLGANSRVWARAVPVMTNEEGQISYQTNSYTELATGMYHLVNGQWVESTENIQITTGGGVATNGQHQVAFAADINTSNAVQITTPDALQLNTHIMGLTSRLMTAMMLAVPRPR
jgi:hypothetical protein